MARVIHIRDWNRADPEQVYIGRPGRGLAGPFGNPVAAGRTCPVCGGVHGLPGATLACYEQDLRRRLAQEPVFREAVAGLHSKTLVCFCSPRPCHGDVLARVSAELAGVSGAVA